jgi:hypothetical protein
VALVAKGLSEIDSAGYTLASTSELLHLLVSMAAAQGDFGILDQPMNLSLGSEHPSWPRPYDIKLLCWLLGAALLSRTV